MNDFEAYKLYVSLKNHFSNKSYDYFKYNGKNRLKVSSFEKRKDKVFFLKLAKHTDLLNFLVSNFSQNEKLWIRDLAYSEESEKVYKDWVKRKQSLSYLFKQELNKLDENFDKNFIIEDNEHPKLLKLFLGKEISLETFCLLLEFSGALKYWDKKLEYDPLWESVKLKVVKYTPFIDCDRDKLKKLCLDLFQSVE
jgi:hypothetical protein